MLLKFSNPVVRCYGRCASDCSDPVIFCIRRYSTGTLSYRCSTVQCSNPIIMGQNIGTCITAILSAIGAKKNAKRAAAVHLYFNLDRNRDLYDDFYIINAFFIFIYHQVATPAGIAVIHSVFNVTATIVLLPFGNGLVKLACLTICDKKRKLMFQQRTGVYDPGISFPEKPGICSRTEPKCSKKNGRKIQQCTVYSTEIWMDKYSEEGVERVEKMEAKVDRMKMNLEPIW